MISASTRAERGFSCDTTAKSRQYTTCTARRRWRRQQGNSSSDSRERGRHGGESAPQTVAKLERAGCQDKDKDDDWAPKANRLFSVYPTTS
ncbi:hypothetical protein GT037_004765 [Alternaria burnsii]|uniref:Uncharacterized protein n=1 Tax=Alternaria burnsii TaxID=1187904 RepID=A0A8H7EHC9_9PLEO|nr:uncharacterized protein GT037_004765 [Alternaria burnsii]KAF7677906.1 hypothetical protein GT037_004765 [Alternaria burnsii]